MRSILFILAFIIAGPRAFAGPIIDGNVFYFSDSFVYSGTTSTYNRTLWDVSVGMNLSKKGAWVLGWNFDSMSFKDNPGTVTSVSVTDMGPKLSYYIDKARTWSVAFTYDLITKGNYSSGSTTSELRGTAMKFEAGYTPEIWEGVLLGAKLNYYKAAFKEEVVSSSLTKVSYSRTAIYPSFSFIFRWD